MLHFFPTYEAIAEKRDYQKVHEIKYGRDYMEIYLQEAFSIENPFDHNSSTARLFYKALQTQQIAIRQ